MITSSASPASSTAAVRSSRPHGESRLLTRVQNWVSPKSTVVRDLDEAGAGGLLLVGRHAVFEVGEQDVDRRCDVGHLRAHLLVGGREEVDHPARRERDLADGLGGPDGERAEEISGWTHSRNRTGASRAANRRHADQRFARMARRRCAERNASARGSRSPGLGCKLGSASCGGVRVADDRDEAVARRASPGSGRRIPRPGGGRSCSAASTRPRA